MSHFVERWRKQIHIVLASIAIVLAIMIGMSIVEKHQVTKNTFEGTFLKQKYYMLCIEGLIESIIDVSEIEASNGVHGMELAERMQAELELSLDLQKQLVHIFTFSQFFDLEDELESIRLYENIMSQILDVYSEVAANYLSETPPADKSTMFSSAFVEDSQVAHIYLQQILDEFQTDDLFDQDSQFKTDRLLDSIHDLKHVITNTSSSEYSDLRCSIDVFGK